MFLAANSMAGAGSAEVWSKLESAISGSRKPTQPPMTFEVVRLMEVNRPSTDEEELLAMWCVLRLSQGGPQAITAGPVRDRDAIVCIAFCCGLRLAPILMIVLSRHFRVQLFALPLH